MTYRDRREARAERLTEWAEKRDAKADAALDRAHEMGEAIPLGQPIMGAQDRRYRQRMRETAERGYEHADKAKEMRSKAANISAALDSSIFDDDPDAAARLRERIAGLEAERTRWRAYNASCRKGAPDLSLLDDHQRGGVETLVRVGMLKPDGSVPAFQLSNLGARIRNDKNRLERLEAK